MIGSTIEEGSILRMVLTEMAREGYLYAPVGVSMRHVHLSRKDLDILFGSGYELHPLRGLVQPGQYAAQEQVMLQGPKGRLEKVRIIGPVRGETQVELSLTDALSIGLKEVPVRMSGHLQDTPGIRITGPAGELAISRGTIVAARHLHLSEEQARAFHIHDGQVVCVKTGGGRSCILDQVVCRTGKGHELEFHVDTDEANACLLKNGDVVQILTGSCDVSGMTDHGYAGAPAQGWTDSLHAAGGPAGNEDAFDPGRISGKVVFSLTGRSKDRGERMDRTSLFREETRTAAGEEILELVTEQDINHACRAGKDHVYRTADALITPSAADRAAELGIEILKADMPAKAQGADWRAAGVKAPAGMSAGSGTGSREDLLDLVTASELNAAFRDNKKELYCTQNVIITPAAVERIAETGIRIVRVSGS